MTSTVAGTATVLVMATQVPDGKRLDFLPRHFGRYMLPVESNVYDWLGELCTEYSGGYWQFVELSNGGALLTPPASRRYTLECPNGFRETVSHEAAGIIACLYALSNLSIRYNYDPLAKHYHWLRDYAAEHAEAAAIFRAID